jgi:hypothetical protein
MLGLEAATHIHILTEENAPTYWEHSDSFDLALDLTAGRRGLVALSGVLEAWARHLLAVEAEIAPLVELRDARLTWYVGLDAEATRIGDLLWRGEPLDAKTSGRIVGLFRMIFRDRDDVLPKVAGEPVYLILAMTAEGVLRMKPQNLVTGLPIRHLEAAT